MKDIRALLGGGKPLLLPGVYDALSARMAGLAGFRAACIGGAAVALSQHALPDLGLQSFGEYRDSVAGVLEGSPLPLLLDAENGFGNAAHVDRTVRQFERMGVAGMVLEDLEPVSGTTPAVASMDIVAGKLEQALRARRHPRTFLVGRTDAAHVIGLDEAIARARCYEKIGMDAVLVTGLRSLDEMRRLRDSVSLTLVAVAAQGKPWVCPSADQACRLGYDIVIFPSAPVLGAMTGLLQAYQAIAGDTLTGQSFDAALGVMPAANQAAYWQGLEENGAEA